MHIFPGTLIVEEITGRKGKFCVGNLRTSIGEFKVKDAKLEQFSPGSYEGRFTVLNIYTKGVPWRGGIFTELRAEIAEDGYIINDESAIVAVPVPQQVEPDPLEETIEISAMGESSPVEADAQTQKVYQLFGSELAPLVLQYQEVSLDTTVERQLFREQKDYIKSLGYRFNSQSQSWSFPSH